jgi:UPF0271 protein
MRKHSKNLIDINCDMGESFGAYRIGNDEEIIRYITSANIACGFHASDPNVMERTVKLCKRHRVMPGAHPGYRDLIGFGRRFLDMKADELINDIIYQVGAFTGFLKLHDLPLQHVKLHGALYNYLVTDKDMLLSVATALKKAFGNPVFLTLGTAKMSRLKRVFRKRGIRLALEAFPDRMYTDDGELLPRKNQEAVLKDPDAIAARAVLMVKEKGIHSINDCWIEMDIDTLCVHGDNYESIEAAKIIRAKFKKEHIEIGPLAKIL